jgi:tetratricopeptide (TPR) repeat protein
VLIAFPFAATFAASGQPITRPSESAAPPSATSSGAKVRDLPLFTPGGVAAATVARGTVLTDLQAMHVALRAAMDELFDPRQRTALEQLLPDSTATLSFTEPPYPFRFERLAAVLDTALPAALDQRQTRAANDLGALLVLAAAHFGDELPTAAPLGYAILDRARSGGACLPQLNLAFLLSTHVRPRADKTAAEFGRAERSCPDDPTPLWLLGQFQSQSAILAGEDDQESERSPQDALRPVLATFHRLERRFPGSSSGWAGEADAELRVGYQLQERQPFSARSRFRRALSLYGQAGRLDADPTIAAGEGRAYAGQRLYGDAARVQRRAIAGTRRPAQLEARLVEYLERDRHFAEAAAAASTLAAAPRFPAGAALFMQLAADGVLASEDGQEPLSLGSGRLLAVSLDVAPVRPRFTQGAPLIDLSFIPQYRDVDAVTGYERWCPDWLYRRDLVLAGGAEEALAGFPDSFKDIRPGFRDSDCPGDGFDTPVLAAVAELETGDRNSAIKHLGQADADTGVVRPIGFLLDARQNMWRFAGQLDKARLAAEEWTREAPGSRVAFDRAGEVAFLAKDYDRAARLFAMSARIARSQFRTWSPDEAQALLKRGTALEFGGHYVEALAELRESDEVASRAYALAAGEENEAALNAYLSYNARLQAGDTYLHQGRYADALEQYAAARDRERVLPRVRPGGPLRRPEVLDNNQALVEIRVGNPRAALQAIRRAVQADPLNPIFLQNLGLALQRLKLSGQAVAAYRAAVDSDPTMFPAWNDLGVVLAGQGRLREAAVAFRHAVGVRSDYALGWFNLGVALDRMGLRHTLASEGALARAFRADPDLRGRTRTFVADDDLYFTTLDLSKPLPPKWEFASTQERTPVAVVGLGLALLFGLQFGRTAMAPGMGSQAKRWLELGRDSLARLPSALISTTAGIAVAATVAVFLLPLLRSPDRTFASALLLVLGVLALIVIVVRSRVLAARRAGVTLRQRGWTPGIVVGLGAAAAGLGWAPLPVVETDRPAPAVHWIGPVVTGAAALCLLTLGVGLGVPTTKALGTAALVMTASLLTPIEPLDGSYVAKGPAGLAAGLALLGAAVFLLLGLS